MLAVEVLADTTPAQPYNLKASNLTDTSAQLTWQTDTPHYSDRWLIYKRQTNGTWYKAGTSTSKNFTATVNDMTGSYQFIVYGESGSPAWSGTRSLASEMITVPAKPTNLSVSNVTSTTAKLTWETSEPHGADRWLIYKRQTNGTWVQAGTSTAKSYTVTVNDMTNSYQFRVYGENGSTAWSGIKSLPSEIVTIPAKPKNLSVSDVTSTTAKLTWTTSSPHGADRWLIYKRQTNGTWVEAGTSTAKSYTVTVNDMTNSYQFRVYGENGSPGWSGLKSLPSEIVTVPAKPTNLSASNVTAETAKLTWTTSSPHGADRWLIYKKEAGGGWVSAGRSTAQSFTLSGLSPNTTYQFKVYGESGSPAWSGVRSLVSNTASCTTLSDSSYYQTVLDNIQNSTVIYSDKKAACIAVARELLENDFEISYISGILANICYEGNTGIFEYYNENVDYHPNFDSYLRLYYNTTYVDEFSGKYIYNKNVTDVYDIFCDLDNMNWYYNDIRIGTGMGCIGWSFQRALDLVRVYREINNNSTTITLEQTMMAESLMVLRELTTDYIKIYNNWRAANGSNLESPSAAYYAAAAICMDYESPDDKQTQADTRGNFAKQIFNEIF